MLELVVVVTSADSDCIWGTMRGYLGNKIFAGPVSGGPVSLGSGEVSGGSGKGSGSIAGWVGVTASLQLSTVLCRVNLYSASVLYWCSIILVSGSAGFLRMRRSSSPV